MLLSRKLTVPVVTLVLLSMTSFAMAAPGDVGTEAIDFTLDVYNDAGPPYLPYTLSDQAGQVILMFVIGYT